MSNVKVDASDEDPPALPLWLPPDLELDAEDATALAEEDFGVSAESFSDRLLCLESGLELELGKSNELPPEERALSRDELVDVPRFKAESDAALELDPGLKNDFPPDEPDEYVRPEPELDGFEELEPDE